jgi:hypothetical protein
MAKQRSGDKVGGDVDISEAIALDPKLATPGAIKGSTP